MQVRMFDKEACGLKILIYLSDFMIPLVLFYIVGFGLLMRKNIYDDFVRGAKSGARTVVEIMPTLVGLMVAVGILRASGFLDFLAGMFRVFTDKISIPPEFLPVAIVKLFSSSAATGLALDIFREYGPDSPVGMMVSILLSSTETVFYTMSVYFMSARVTKTRYTLAGALVATFAGVVMSVVLAGMV